MALLKYKPGEYFRRSVLAKPFEQSSEQSEDNSVDISRKDLMVMNQLSTRVRGKAARLGKCGRGLATLKIKEVVTIDASANKIEFTAKILRFSVIIAIALGTRLCT